MPTAFKILPKNYLSDWGDMEAWAESVGSAPSGWIISSSAIISQETTAVQFGSFAASVTGSVQTGGLYRTIPNGDDYAGRTFRLGVYGKSASTGPFIRLSDGVSEVTYHLDGLDALAFHTTPILRLDKNATELRVDLNSIDTVATIFDSAVLCEGEELFTSLSDTNIAIAQYRPSLRLRQNSFEIAGREGSFIPEVHLSQRNIRLSGSVQGSDPDSARNNFDNLMKSLLGWQNNEQRELYLYDNRVAEVFLNSFNWDYVTGMKDIFFDMNFVNQRSTTRYINKLRHRQVISATTTVFNFTYNGSSESKPLLQFVADQGAVIQTCQLENLTTGELIVYSGTVPQNVSLEIDCDVGSVFNSSINRIADFGTSDFLKLVRGDNYFRFHGDNCTINIDYFERFL